MHQSAHDAMKRCVERYMPSGRAYDVVDFGSRCSPGQTLTHRDLLHGHDCRIMGVDVKPGRNVDRVMTKPYRVPLPRNSADVIFSGQVFEHIPFFWASILELARVLRPGGHLFLTVPSRGHVHDVKDCWRFYSDSMNALAVFSGLEVIEARTDFPPTIEGRRHHDYGQIDMSASYWGDTVGVLRKPVGRQPLSISVVRVVLRWWANRLGDLSRSGPTGQPGAQTAARATLARAGGEHAEIEQIWTRDQHVSVVFAAMPPQASTFVLRSRERQTDRRYAVQEVDSGRRRVDIPISDVASASESDSEIWDTFALAQRDDGQVIELRVGKHHDDMPGKKRIITFPGQRPMDDDSVVVTPYYTLHDNLSIRCRRTV